MQISGDASDSNDTTGTDPSDSGSAQDNIGMGNYAAYYRIPTLNSTLAKWQSGAGLAPFTYQSSSQNYSSVSTSKFGGVNFGISYEEIGVNGQFQKSDAKSSSEVKASSFGLSFAGLALVGIEQGSWFDNYRVARAAETPDSQHAPVQHIFANETYFGSKDQPGPLAAYNYQALVGFQPSWTIQMEDAISSSSQDSTEGGGGISIFGLLDIGGYYGSNTTKTSTNNSTNTITVSDDTNNAYIIGFVQSKYWAS